MAKSTATSTKSRSPTSGLAKLQLPQAQPKAPVDKQSHKGFTVFTPNPNKRKDIQKKAEAELAALEDFPLSRAMGYVSLTPRPVGGRLTLEEVRIKQQQEMKIKDNKKQGPIDFQ